MEHGPAAIAWFLDRPACIGCWHYERSTQMHPVEKLAWVVLLISLTVLEVHSIRRSDRENQKVRSEENRRFNEISMSLASNFTETARNLGQSYKATTDGFTATLKGNERLLREASRTNSVAEESLRNITGGDAFAVFVPIEANHASVFAQGSSVLHSLSFSILNLADFNAYMQSQQTKSLDGFELFTLEST